MKGYRFVKNEEVAHIGNLKLKLFVKKLLWKTVLRPTGKIDPKSPEENPAFEKEKKRMFDGVMVYWWTGDNLNESRFHAEQLVPWYVAEKGEQAAEEWLNEMKTANQGSQRRYVSIAEKV